MVLYLYLTPARDLGRVCRHALYTACLPCACTQPTTLDRIK